MLTIISIAILIFCVILLGATFNFWIKSHKHITSGLAFDLATFDTIVFSVLAIGGVASLICLVM